MKFGEVPVESAEGCILAHATMAGQEKIKKGTRLTAAHITSLSSAGVSRLIVAKLDPEDIGEDEAATRLSIAACGKNIRCASAATGRVNLYAEENGVVIVDKNSVDRLNRMDPGITLATLPAFSQVSRGQMVATAKIIPFAVSRRLLDELDAAAAHGAVKTISVAPFKNRKVAVISTLLSGLKPTVVDKTLEVLRSRLAPSGSIVAIDLRVRHDERDVADAMRQARKLGAEMIIAFGASAVVDAEDVIPAAIVLAGGTVEHVGMPVDPGNLLVLGAFGEVPVIGAPGCARSPKENGFDFVLNRLLADVPVTSADITGMGVGGLLMEIPSRPLPRETTHAKRRPEVAALVLAAGQSRRSGASHKLKSTFEGVPLLRRTCQTVLSAGFPAVNVVLGFEHEILAQQLHSINANIIINPGFAEGLSTSLKAGVDSLPPSTDGVLVVLADMPAVTASDLKRLADAFGRAGGQAVIRATDHGKRGNPVILPRSVFADIARLQGDVGAKPIIEGYEGRVIDLEIGAAASVDVDTAEAIKAAGGIPPG